jgi:hypothetical protein
MTTVIKTNPILQHPSPHPSPSPSSPPSSIYSLENKDKLEVVLDWSNEHPEFNTKFIESLANQSFNLTINQEYSLCNIIRKWKIDKWYKTRSG